MSSDTMIVLNLKNSSIIDETEDYLEILDLPLIPLPADSQSGPDLMCFLIYVLSGCDSEGFIYNCYRHLSIHFVIIKHDFSQSEFYNNQALPIFINSVRIQYNYSGNCRWYEWAGS